MHGRVSSKEMSHSFGQNSPSIKALHWIKRYKELDQKRVKKTLSEREEKEMDDLQRKISFVLDPSSKTTAPKRQFLRVDTDLKITLATKKDFKEVYIKNISGGGVYISTSEKFNIGNQVEFTVEIEETHKSMKISGEVAWTNPKGFRNLPPGVGLKLKDLNIDQERFIQQLVHALLDQSILKEDKKP